MSDQAVKEKPMANGKQETGTKTTRPAMPLFYTAPHPVNNTRHGKHGFIDHIDLEFARTSNVIPVNIGEMSLAAKDFPIVFGAEPPHLPVMVCGLQAGENVFITDENLWAKNTYVPAYVRRYPFIFMEMPERDQMVLCVDESTNLLMEGGERLLFDEDGKQTDIVDRALEFCRAFHQQYQATREFASALVEQDLLVDNETEIRLSENRKIELKGYKIIDSKKLGELDDAVFLDWRKRDWLPTIYYQLQSGSNWPNVLQLAAARAEEKATAAADKD